MTNPDPSTLLGIAAVITAIATLVQTIRATPPRPSKAKRAKRPPAAEASDHAPDPPPAAARLAIAWRCALTLLFAGASAATGPPAGALPPPIAAHHALLGGSASCSAGDQLVAWSIGNSQPRQPMTIVSATATLDGAPWPVVGYTSPVPPSGATEATTTLSGDLSGPLVLDVLGTWPDGHHWSGTAPVALLGDCSPATTSTTSTTSPSSSSTSSPPTSAVEGTSTSEPQPSTTSAIPPPGSSTTSPRPPELARTGGPVADAVVVGLSVIAFGSCVLLIARNRRRPYAVARRARRRRARAARAQRRAAPD